MLFWHKHNIEKALADLPNFTPFPDEWTVEDKVLFEQAFSFHGKSFHRIRQMVSNIRMEKNHIQMKNHQSHPIKISCSDNLPLTSKTTRRGHVQKTF